MATISKNVSKTAQPQKKFCNSRNLSSVSLTLSLSVMSVSIFHAIRAKQYYWRYVIMFTAGLFQSIRSIILIAMAIQATNLGYIDLFYSSTAAMIFFDQMFPLLLFCTFFEVCRTIINIETKNASITAAATTINHQQQTPRQSSANNTPNVTVTATATPSKEQHSPLSYTKKYFKKKLISTYTAYLWTFIILIVMIAFCGTYSSIETEYGERVRYSQYTFSQAMPFNVIGMYTFSRLGLWAYVFYGIMQLWAGWKELRPYKKSLLSFFFIVFLLPIIGYTVTAVYLMDPYAEAYLIISFITVNLVGLFGLLWATYASRAYWSPSQIVAIYNNAQQQPPMSFMPGSQTPVGAAALPQQQQYAIMQSSPLPSTSLMATTPIISQTQPSSNQLVYQQQQQYPIVQIPQQQFQPGQPYPIVQIPIDQFTQANQQQQYPTVFLQSVSSPQPPDGQHHVAEQQHQQMQNPNQYTTDDHR
ncbi:hypothetical protein BDA99DRAFT_537486 [Phascolomyces articulosus]|uniref:Uncharacterized protein n=1 Tax=Phascolomyces articulosus TaxID=60185 RepID=A0AAD5JZJ1_9FUNG|nr:hypothetical protein BDA99DRAFT_537486 [Phascolomyces articulosus]